MSRIYPFEAVSLTFAPNALEPALDAEVTREHYINHYMRYIDGLNTALASYPIYQSWPLAKLVAFSQSLPQSIRQNVAHNADGCFNHELYWQTMSTYSCNTQTPSGDLKLMIDQCFGDYATFQNNFTQAALNLVGSGWVWLISENKTGRLMIQTTPNQATPLNGRFTPILTLDMWEHAYYDQYQSEKDDYVNAWWQLINWDNVAELWNNAVNPASAEYTYTLAHFSEKPQSNYPYGCTSDTHATPAGESYYQHKHLNTFANPCGGKSHASNSYYITKSRSRHHKKR